MKLILCVYLALNRWKVDISSDPSIYLFLVVIFYQRSAPFFLYGFQFNWNFKDLPIQKIVSWCIITGGCLIRGLQTLQHEIDINDSWWLEDWSGIGESLRDRWWGTSMMITLKGVRCVGWEGLQWWKTWKRYEECSCNFWYRVRGVSGEKGGTRGWGNFNDDDFLKRAEKCP